jgi:hypothetical protein
MENCESNKCVKTDNNCHSTGCDMTDAMLCLADQAWESLMIDKMKKVFEEHNGEKMNKVARATVDSANAHWKTKMEAMGNKHMAKTKLQEAFRG